MSSLNMNIPRDIPWKRIAVSNDMIDRKVCDKEFPLRWQTSIALYDYEPEEEDQEHDGMIVSYLKVSCSITGFQPRGDEVGLHHSDARWNVKDGATGDYLIDPSRWDDTRVIQAYKEAIEDYYGCYGAILEVSVAPKGSDEEIANIPNSKYPYFIDFEPKKRELYEVVSETGEMMSRSLNGINVKKGSTTSESHEVLDIFQGASAEGSYAGTGGGASFSGQWGTKDLNQTEFVDMRTTDSSREKRESFSHTTQLTQMYHQLNSYHVGTNRATFYVLPRPHTVQMGSDDETEVDRSTFVNGPRLLEGIQDFFLIVMRPKEIKEICVEAYLETAHIFQEKIPEFQPAENFVDEFVVNGSINEREGETELVESEEEAVSFLDKVADAAIGGAIGSAFGVGGLGTAIGFVSSYFDDSRTNIYLTAIARKFNPTSTDLEFDLPRSSLSNCTTTSDRKNYIGCEMPIESFQENEITCIGSVFSKDIFIDHQWPKKNDNKEELGKATIRVTMPQRHKVPVLKNGDKSLFLTGRGVCSCPSVDVITPPAIVWERPSKLRAYSKSTESSQKISRIEANEIRDHISNMLFKSIGDPNRKPRGKTYFAESDFFAKNISNTLADSFEGNMPAEEVRGLPEKFVQILKSQDNYVSRKNILDTDTRILMREFKIDYDEVMELRRSMLGLVTVEEADKIPPIKSKTVTVPNLLGLRLNEVNRITNKLNLNIGNRTYIDNCTPRNVILNQSPSADSEVVIESQIDLELSTGLSVRIPDIEQMLLTDALLVLRRAGLLSEPKIMYIDSSDETSNNRIKSSCPPMREYVTPNTSVTLEIYCFNDNSPDIE